MKVEWFPAALADRRAIAEFIAEQSPEAAARVIEELIVAADSLASFPHRGRPGLVAGTRELAAVPPYLIVYDVTEDVVRILRLWHAARLRG